MLDGRTSLSSEEGAGHEEYGVHGPPWPAQPPPILCEGASLVPAPCTWAPGQAVLQPKPCPLEAGVTSPVCAVKSEPWSAGAERRQVCGPG